MSFFIPGLCSCVPCCTCDLYISTWYQPSHKHKGKKWTCCFAVTWGTYVCILGLCIVYYVASICWQFECTKAWLFVSLLIVSSVPKTMKFVSLLIVSSSPKTIKHQVQTHQIQYKHAHARTHTHIHTFSHTDCQFQSPKKNTNFRFFRFFFRLFPLKKGSSDFPAF